MANSTIFSSTSLLEEEARLIAESFFSLLIPIMADSELRQRRPAKANDSTPSTSRSRDDGDDDKPVVWLDTLRVLTFLILASCGLSYVISGGHSFFWGKEHTPQYLRAEWWRSQFVSRTPPSSHCEEDAHTD